MNAAPHTSKTSKNTHTTTPSPQDSSSVDGKSKSNFGGRKVENRFNSKSKRRLFDLKKMILDYMHQAKMAVINNMRI